MKTIIYFSFIAVLFSSCIGNSFRTQKYTHFKHSSGHKAVEQQALVKEQSSPKTQQTNISENEEPVSCSASNGQDAALMAVKNSMDKPTGNRTVFTKAANKEEVKDQSTTKEIKHKKTVKEKAQAAKGVIGTALKIVLLVVVLAVVVGLIILVVLLG